MTTRPKYAYGQKVLYLGGKQRVSASVGRSHHNTIRNCIMYNITFDNGGIAIVPEHLLTFTDDVLVAPREWVFASAYPGTVLQTHLMEGHWEITTLVAVRNPIENHKDFVVFIDVMDTEKVYSPSDLTSWGRNWIAVYEA